MEATCPEAADSDQRHNPFMGTDAVKRCYRFECFAPSFAFALSRIWHHCCPVYVTSVVAPHAQCHCCCGVNGTAVVPSLSTFRCKKVRLALHLVELRNRSELQFR